ncbi:transposase [Marinitoga sp. 1155]|nr:transposase [Marinitoga sp. 1155]
MLLAGKFDPQIVKKRQRYILAIEDMVLFLYSKDLSIRDYVKDISAIIN